METQVLLVMVGSLREAETIARAVVKERLAACANVIPGAVSIYWWEGKLCEGDEVLMVVKARGDRVEPLIKRIQELHSYQVPAIVTLPVVGGNQAYLKWVQEQVS